MTFVGDDGDGFDSHQYLIRGLSKGLIDFFFGDELRLTIDFSYSRVTRVGQWTASLVTQTGGIILILAKVLTHCLIMRLTSSRCSFDLIRTKLMVSEKMESKKRSQVEKKHPHVHRFQ